MCWDITIDPKVFAKRQLSFFRSYVQAKLEQEVSKAEMVSALKEMKARFCKDGKVSSMPMLRAEFDWARHAVMRELGLDQWRHFDFDVDNQIMQIICDTMIAEISKE